MLFSKRQIIFLLFSYMLVIFILSHIPSGTNNAIDYARFKWFTQEIGNLLHIPLFGGLAYLWIKYFQCLGYSQKTVKYSALLLSLLYGISDEAHQYFIPGRFASFSDLLLNLVGILLVLKFYPVIDYFFRIKIKVSES